jgi:hypothetical protein
VRSPGKPTSGRARQPDRDGPIAGEIVGGSAAQRALPAGRHGLSDDAYNFDHLREPASERESGRRYSADPPERHSAVSSSSAGFDTAGFDTAGAGSAGSGSAGFDMAGFDMAGFGTTSGPLAGSATTRSGAVAPGPPPSWAARIRSARPAVVRPGATVAIALTTTAALGWLLVVAYGFDHLPLLWTLVAFVAGGAGLALTVRAFPIPGAIVLLLGVIGWGLATRDLVPQAATDILGDLRLFGWNLAFAAPALLAHLGALRVDARRSAHAEVRSIADERRWWGGEHRDHEPRLGVLEAIPSVRFFAVPGQICTHLVVAGRQIALVGATVWPPGDYTNDQADVLRNGRFFGPGTDDVGSLMNDTRTWVKRFTDTPVTCRAFLVVHPASERATDEVRLVMPSTEYADVLHADTFAEVVGEFLMREPYRIDVPVIQLLMDKLVGERNRADRPASARRIVGPAEGPASAGRTGRMGA